MPTSPAHVLLYSGHMTDAPDRADERFPERKAVAIRRHIDAYLEKWRTGPGWLAIGGAARGADLLFAEACLARGMEVAVHLALPPDEFERRSVRGWDEESGWEARFRRLLDGRDGPSRVRIMPADFAWVGEHVFAAANRWMLETGASHAGRADIRVMVVWDERPGDGEGGTEHFVERVREMASALPRAGERAVDEAVVVLNPLEIDEDPYAARRRRLSAPGPKRVLALDGDGAGGRGGVRGRRCEHDEQSGAAIAAAGDGRGLRV